MFSKKDGSKIIQGIREDFNKKVTKLELALALHAQQHLDNNLAIKDLTAHNVLIGEEMKDAIAMKDWFNTALTKKK